MRGLRWSLKWKEKKVPEIVVCKFSGSTLSIILKHAKKVYYAESVFVLIIFDRL